jgi:hypothetical protein
MAVGGGTFGAGDGIRTRDIDLGKVALYQLSYSRPWENPILLQNIPAVKRSGKRIENKEFILLKESRLLVLCYFSVDRVEAPTTDWRPIPDRGLLLRRSEHR